MAQIVRLGGGSKPVEPSPVAVSFDPRRGLLTVTLVLVIVLALGVVVYASLPRTPANITAGPSTPDVSDDSAVYDPDAAKAQQQVRQAEQEKEDSAVFGQAPSASAYKSPSRN